MKDAHDPNALTVGIDASILIDLAKSKALGVLKEVLNPIAVPALVKEEIKRGRGVSPANSKTILGFSGVEVVTAEHEDDLQLISDLHQVWGSTPPKNDGEAELIALARRHGWVALLEDEEARNTAILEGVKVARLSSCIAAAVACGRLGPDRGWRLHVDFHAQHTRHTRDVAAARGGEDRPVFDIIVHEFSRAHVESGRPNWPTFLLSPQFGPGDLDLLYNDARQGA